MKPESEIGSDEEVFCAHCGCPILNPYVESPLLLGFSCTAKQELCFSCSFKAEERERRFLRCPYRKPYPRLTLDGKVPEYLLLRMEQYKAERQGR